MEKDEHRLCPICGKTKSVEYFKKNNIYCEKCISIYLEISDKTLMKEKDFKEYESDRWGYTIFKCQNCSKIFNPTRRQMFIHLSIKKETGKSYTYCKECDPTTKIKEDRNKKKILKKIENEEKENKFIFDETNLLDIYDNFLNTTPDWIRQELLDNVFLEDIEDGSKECIRCGENKPFKMFQYNNQTKSYMGTCDDCMSVYRKESMQKPAYYNTFKDKVLPEDKPKNEDGFLTIVCKLCKKRFHPTRLQVYSRELAINTPGREGSFYCSNECKQSCPLYRKSVSDKDSFQIDHQLMYQVKKEARKRAKHMCEICNEKKQLKVHHINPIKISPLEAYDLENLIVLCHDCHMNYGHGSKECSTGYLAYCKRKNKTA